MKGGWWKENGPKVGESECEFIVSRETVIKDFSLEKDKCVQQ